MIKIKNENQLLRKTKSLCLKIFNALENNGNCEFDSNGEAKFISDFLATLKNNEPVIFDVGSNVGLYIHKILEYAAILRYTLLNQLIVVIMYYGKNFLTIRI
jgi:hypothetical protein